MTKRKRDELRNRRKKRGDTAKREKRGKRIRERKMDIEKCGRRNKERKGDMKKRKKGT